MSLLSVSFSVPLWIYTWQTWLSFFIWQWYLLFSSSWYLTHNIDKVLQSVKIWSKILLILHFFYKNIFVLIWTRTYFPMLFMSNMKQFNLFISLIIKLQNKLGNIKCHFLKLSHAGKAVLSCHLQTASCINVEVTLNNQISLKLQKTLKFTWILHLKFFFLCLLVTLYISSYFKKKSVR